MSGGNIIVYNSECPAESVSFFHWVASACFSQHCKGLDALTESSLLWNERESLQ